MAVLLTIGEFSRATHVSVKALRHYDDVGLLTPADVDPATGYRFYAAAQVPAAQVIRRFRDLDMPLDEIRAVLHADDTDARDRVILEHLARMEAKLEETQTTVASLRALLTGGGAPIQVEHRTLPKTRAIAIAAAVAWDDTEAWLGDALAELNDVADRQRAGPDGACYSEEFFEAHHGEVVAFVPVQGDVDARGRVRQIDLPGGTFAVTVHRGPFATIDTTYGALGTYVVERAIGAGGAIREHYLVTDEPDDEHTEVCWPIQ